MKLIDFRQTVFETKEGLNKTVVIFDEIIPGAKAEISGINFNIMNIRETVFLPSVKSQIYTALILTLPSGVSESFPVRLEPVRKLKVSIINSPAEKTDSGKISEQISAHFDKVIEIISMFGEYKYTAESIEYIKSYEKSRSDAQIKTLYNFIKSGNIEINPILPGIQMHLLGYEMLPRSLYGIIDLKNKSGISPETIVLKTISGISSSAITALCGAGIKYAIAIRSDYRNSEFIKSLPNVIKLMSSDKKSSITILIIPRNEQQIFDSINTFDISCNKPESIQDEYFACRIALNKTDLSRFEDELEIAAEKYMKYGTVPLFPYCSEPQISLSAFCDHMSQKWKFPVFTVSTATEVMKGIEIFSNEKIPEIHGEISDNLSDFVTAYPSLTAAARKLSEEFCTKESIAALKATKNKDYTYPDSLLKDTRENITHFFCCTHSSERKLPLKKAFFNYEQDKLIPVKKAESNLEAINITAKNGKSDKIVTVYNPAPFYRNIPLNTDMILENIRCQSTGQKYITEPVKLAPFGAKSFEICEKFRKSKPFAHVTQSSVSTGHYNISYCNKTGRIYSIVDSCALRELIDSKSDYSLGDYIYATTDGKLSDKTDINTAEANSVEIENGELAVSIIKKGTEEQSGAAVKTKITFYKYSRNIDIRTEFNGAASLMGDFSDTFRKNIFIAFPLKCDNGTFLTENNGYVTDEKKNILPVNSRDFSVVTSWAAIDNEKYGIAVFPSESPIFHYGSLKYNKFSQCCDLSSSTFFLHAASNRLNKLYFKTPDDCKGSFNVTLLPYSGQWSNVLPKILPHFNKAPVIYPGYTMNSSIIKLNSENVRMLAFKPAENKNGFILRFLELSGASAKTHIELPFEIRKAFYTSIIEDDIMPNNDFDGTKLYFNISAHSYTTLRVIPGAEISVKLSSEQEFLSI